MSAAQKVQQHPAFIQAQNKANYYMNQLDKEVSISYVYFLNSSLNSRIRSIYVDA